ncbi:hypothetical protein Btru_075828 [Bulinus truncatus]|nr:hypothetical protein Btru_075828 [Bulinus truncatus]
MYRSNIRELIALIYLSFTYLLLVVEIVVALICFALIFATIQAVSPSLLKKDFDDLRSSKAADTLSWATDILLNDRAEFSIILRGGERVPAHYPRVNKKAYDPTRQKKPLDSFLATTIYLPS